MARTGSCWLEGRPQGHALSSLVNRKAGVGVPRWVHSAPATASPPVPHSVQRTHCAPSPLQVLLVRHCPGAAPSLKVLGMWGVHCAMAGGTGVGRAASSLVLQEELPCLQVLCSLGKLGWEEQRPPPSKTKLLLPPAPMQSLLPFTCAWAR